MSQMPDKLWVHKYTKYNTADGVYAYQYEFAQDIQDEGIENFVEYVNKEAFIEKACEWLYGYNQQQAKRGAKAVLSIRDFTINVEDFRKAMEDKQ